MDVYLWAMSVPSGIMTGLVLFTFLQRVGIDIAQSASSVMNRVTKAISERIA